MTLLVSKLYDEEATRQLQGHRMGHMDPGSAWRLIMQFTGLDVQVEGNTVEGY